MPWEFLGSWPNKRRKFNEMVVNRVRMKCPWGMFGNEMLMGACLLGPNSKTQNERGE